MRTRSTWPRWRTPGAKWTPLAPRGRNRPAIATRKPGRSRPGADSSCKISISSRGSVMTKYVFVTGGVVSSLGKGIAAASLAAILESRKIKVSLVKLDPYINVDPGTMSPFQHGEVFVTED